MRFWLALWVVLHHITGRHQMLEAAAMALPTPLFTMVRNGYLAVTTFFVLSGFVLARTYGGTPWTPRNLARYGLGRVARVYPVYLLSLASIAPFILADRVPGKAALVAEHGLLVQGWLGHVPVGWNTPAWSLSCEMFFYLAFPLLMAVLRGAGWRKVLAMAGAACLLTRVMMVCGVSEGLKPLIHISDFAMGIAASCAYDLLRETGRPLRAWWFYGPAGAAWFALVAWPQLAPAPLDLNSLLRPLNGLLLIGFALGGRGVRPLSGAVTVFLGKASYAMYILHVPVFWWYARLAAKPQPLVYVAIVIAASALVYRFFEEPANRWLRARI
jgi:peptidoglycan/LPS O-acetylase OafA/YrhL